MKVFQLTAHDALELAVENADIALQYFSENKPMDFVLYVLGTAEVYSDIYSCLTGIDLKKENRHYDRVFNTLMAARSTSVLNSLSLCFYDLSSDVE